MPSHVETSSRSAFNCCIWACALRLSDQKSGAMLSSSSLLICVVLFARSKTHHGFLDAFLQAFDLVYKFIHSTIVSRFVCVVHPTTGSVNSPGTHQGCQENSQTLHPTPVSLSLITIAPSHYSHWEEQTAPEAILAGFVRYSYNTTSPYMPHL